MSSTVNGVITQDSTNFRHAANIGSEADWRNLNTFEYTRRRILISHLWLLGPDEIPWVTNIFLRRATATRISQSLNDLHEWKDRLEFSNKLWDIEFINLSMDMLNEMADPKNENNEELLLSFRENSVMNITVVIIRRPTEPVKGRIKEL